MFNWVVKVVPQPPDAPGILGDRDAAAKPPVPTIKAKEVKTPVANPPPPPPPPPPAAAEDFSEESQAQTGVLGWLSNGFISALPQPSGSPRLSNNSDARSQEDGERSGVMTWVAQGLSTVLPQPDEKYRETNDKKEEHTEVYEVEEYPDYDPLPHIPVVEMFSEDEGSEGPPPQFPPKVVDWIKQAIPQPVILPPGAVIIEPSPRSTRSSLDKIMSPPPESLSGISLDTEGKGLVGWFVSGMGLRLPQPTPKSKDDGAGEAEVLQKGGKALRAP